MRVGLYQSWLGYRSRRLKTDSLGVFVKSLFPDTAKAVAPLALTGFFCKLHMYLMQTVNWNKWQQKHEVHWNQ